MTTVLPPTAVAPRRWSPARARVRRYAPTLVRAAVAAGGLVVLKDWWDTTPHVAATTADVCTNVGRVLGLLAGYLCAILLLLMGRIPLLESVIGTNELARWHARTGRYTVNAIVGHVGFVIVGYAATFHQGLVAQTLDLERHYADILMATVAFFLFLLVAMSSARAARRRMRYETWYLLHLYTYLAIGLAFAHEFATGAQFMADRAARVRWAALYAVAVGTLVWYRLLVPLRAAWRHRIAVSEVVAEGPDVVSVVLTGLDVGGLRAEAGQYLRLRFLTRTGWWQSHPYSLSAAPTTDRLRVTVKGLGDHTSELGRSLRPGVRVLVEGPYGALTERRRSSRRVLLIAGGIGITPLRALFETLQGDPGEVTLLYRASRPEDVVFREELDALATGRGFTVHYLVGPRDPRSGAPLDLHTVRHLVPDVAERDCYLCGPAAMERAIVTSLRACGVPPARIHTEQFAL